MSFDTQPESDSRKDARLIQILLVEDSPADVELTIQALREAKVANEVSVVGDGKAAMEFVRGSGSRGDAPRPDLILLDLNLPKKDGREVLAEIKSDPDLARIPIVVLTTSAADEDVVSAYDHHVNSYIRKPLRLDDFIQMMRAIDDYWLGFVCLPPR
jgi:chemotaxis family two-component system response regulator Rcp1